MRRNSWRWTVAVAVAGFMGGGFAQSPCRAEGVASLPAGWQQMSPTDFASAIRGLFNQGTFNSLNDAERVAAEEHGRTLFLQVDLANTALNYQTLEMLEWVARGILDPPEIEKAKTALLARQDDWTGKPYAEIRAKVVMMMRLKVPPAVQINEARRWVVAGGTLAQVPQADLRYDIVRQAFADLKVITGSFSVEWNGRITAPQTGDYKFCISPINVNAGFSKNPVKFSMTVSVGGNVVLNSVPANTGNPSSWPTQSDWVSESNVVGLTAGQPVALKVTASAVALRQLPSATLHALLYWQGPGMTKSLVPADRLSRADTGQPGLKVTYAWTANGQPQTLTRTDPMIDVAWTNPSILLAQDTTVADQAADTSWQTMTSAGFISSVVGPPLKLHPFLKDPDDAAAGFSTARRRTFLDLLSQNPALLDAVDTKTIVRFYHAFRIGNPDKALDVFGTWAARHADLVCEISNDRVFEGDVRYPLASLAIFVTQQLSTQALRLQNEYLQLPDGRCSLPVAYTLADSYVGQKKLADWIALLDARLADPAVTGDLRVNWLLARAQAQELTRTTVRHYPFYYGVPASWPLQGRSFLDQASQAAQSGPVKARVAREIAGRLARSGQFQAGKDLLDQVSNSLPDDQKPMVAAWKKQLDGFIAAQTQALQNRAATAKQAYVGTLKARRDQAASRGDTDAASRYDALINAATSNPTNP